MLNVSSQSRIITSIVFLIYLVILIGIGFYSKWSMKRQSIAFALYTDFLHRDYERLLTEIKIPILICCEDSPAIPRAFLKTRKVHKPWGFAPNPKRISPFTHILKPYNCMVLEGSRFYHFFTMNFSFQKDPNDLVFITLKRQNKKSMKVYVYVRMHRRKQF